MQFRVRGVSKHSPAYLSGIKFGDKICMYTMASQDEIGSNNLVSEKFQTAMIADFKKAHQNKKNVILFVHRPEPKSTPV